MAKSKDTTEVKAKSGESVPSRNENNETSAPGMTTTSNMNVGIDKGDGSPAPQDDPAVNAEKQSGTGTTGNRRSEAVKAADADTFEDTARATKSELDKQPKVQIFAPLEAGERPGTILPVNINGHRYNVPKGQFVSVPKTVAEVISESLSVPMNDLELSNPNHPKAATSNALEPLA